MDKAQALHIFWSSFGLPAIDEQSAYDTGVLENLGIDFPYITYEVATSDFDSAVVLSGSIWYKSPSWAAISQKADEIAAAVGYGGKLLPYDGGALWITRGSPFARRMGEESDRNIRRIYLNINAEYLSA